MRITELLTKETIKMNIEAKDKNGVIKELVTELYNTGIITDADKFEAAIKKESHRALRVSAMASPYRTLRPEK